MSDVHAALSDFPFRLYIFSEDLGNKEGHEIEKVLYAFPSTRSNDDQLKDVGLSEAFIRFYNTFSPHGKYRVLRTAEGRMALYTPEPGVWICLVIKFAASIQSEGFSSNSSSVISAGFMADGVLSTILSNFYEIWHLHMGLISESLQVSGVVDARFLLKNFFDKLISYCQPLPWGLLDIFNGIIYFPLERSLYLKTHSFFSRLECAFPEISCCLFFNENHLIWSGVNLHDTRMLYLYMDRFIPRKECREGVKISEKVNNGIFITPPFVEGKCISQRVHLTSFPKTVTLLSYQLMGTLLMMIIDNESVVDDGLLRRLSDFFSEHLLQIAADLNKSTANLPAYSSKDETNCRFMYFNSSNAALKSILYDEKAKGRKLLVSNDVMTRMMLLADYLYPSDPIEVATSVSTDSWLVVKKCNQRQLFLVVSKNRGTCTLIHVADEMRKLSNSIFSDILFLEI